MISVNKNQTRFYYKEEMKIKQGYVKKMYSKLVLNKFKVMGNFTSIYVFWAANSRKFSRSFKFTCGPCSPM
jgi:hypothetical protein